MGTPPVEFAILIDAEHAISSRDVPTQDRFDPMARHHHTGDAVP
jgi:hypothetical protein